MITAESIDKMWSPGQLMMLTAFLLILSVVVSISGRGLAIGMLFPLSGLTVLTHSVFVADDVFYSAIKLELGNQYFTYLFATSVVPMLYITFFLLVKRKGKSNHPVQPASPRLAADR